MQAGKLRHRVTIQAPARAESPQSGEVRLDWTGAGRDVWAEVRPLTAREVSQYGQTYESATHQVTIRYAAGVTPDCRVVFGDRVLNVVGIINPDERNVELRILTSEEA